MPDGNDDILWSEVRLLRQDVKEMREELTRYKGFIGGVLAAISLLVTLLNLIWAYMRQHIGG